MSVARWSDKSDVYVFEGQNGWECHLCHLNGGKHHIEQTISGMIAHMQAHRDAGHKIPDEALSPESYQF